MPLIPDKIKEEMRRKLAYYFDTDEHDPITPEIIEDWMKKYADAVVAAAVKELQREIEENAEYDHDIKDYFIHLKELEPIIRKVLGVLDNEKEKEGKGK